MSSSLFVTFISSSENIIIFSFFFKKEKKIVNRSFGKKMKEKSKEIWLLFSLWTFFALIVYTYSCYQFITMRDLMYERFQLTDQNLKKKVSLTSWDALAVSGLMMWDNIYFVTEVTVTGEHMGNPINWLTKFTSQKLAVGANCNWVSFNFRCPLIDAENHWYFLSQWSSRFLGLKQVCTGLLWVLSVSMWCIFFGVVIGILFTLVLIYRHSIEIRSYMASYNWDKKLGHFIL